MSTFQTYICDVCGHTWVPNRWDTQPLRNGLSINSHSMNPLGDLCCKKYPGIGYQESTIVLEHTCNACSRKLAKIIYTFLAEGSEKNE